MKIKEQYAKSGPRVKVLEYLQGDNVNPTISHNSKIDIAYNPVKNRNIESGMMPTRKGIMPKKFEAHQQNVKGYQAPAMSFHDHGGHWGINPSPQKHHPLFLAKPPT